jgi:hypothetical protein
MTGKTALVDPTDARGDDTRPGDNFRSHERRAVHPFAKSAALILLFCLIASDMLGKYRAIKTAGTKLGVIRVVTAALRG